MTISFSARRISKRYGGVTALADGALSIAGGEVLALMGANGSGKSTLSKIITGVATPDSGELLLDGQPIRFPDPQAARRHGIVAVYQELSLIPDLTVAENIWLGHEPLRLGRVDTRAVRERTAELLALFQGVVRPTLRPESAVAGLPPDERHIVEILKALSLEPRLMILDEATASLTAAQVERLGELMGDWKQAGMALVLVSHRMDEVFRLADRATVLRNGAHVGDVILADTSEAELVRLMIADGLPVREERGAVPEAARPRLAAENLETATLRGISLSVSAGEILGLGGLGGQGQGDVLLALFGAIPWRGELTVDGQARRFQHPRQAMAHGLALVPGNRGSEGLLGRRSILENLQLPSWRRYGWLTRMARARADAGGIAAKLRLVMSSLDAPVESLSGGNAQKVVLGKWLLREPGVLLLSDPTKGIDVGAKAEFYRMLGGLREQGVAIILYSSDDEELLALCDRVLVLHDGQVSAELRGPQLNRAALVAASMGLGQEHH